MNPKIIPSMLETDIREQLCKKNEIPDLIHLFVKNNKEFEAEMKKLKPFIKKIRISLSGFPGIKKLQVYLQILQKM